jgi:hypothetical protein
MDIGRRHPRRARARPWFAVSVLCLLAAGCGKDSGELEPGSYRAVLDLPGDLELPFALDVAREERGPVLYLINGEERVRVSEVETAPGRVEARMPGYENALSATVRRGRLEGAVSLVHDAGRVLQLPFRAQLGETWRFHEEPLKDNADVSGRWSITLTGEDGRTRHGVAQFQQRFERVTGSVLLPEGDQGWLEGEVHDEELRLSRFDGGAALLYAARLDARGRLVGRFWSDRGGPERFVATRNLDAVVAEPPAPALGAQGTVVSFAFPDVTGRVLQAADPKFAGKVRLIALAGSWSPRSHDLAAWLEQVHRTRRDQGVEVLALMFEQHAEPAPARAAIERFRSAHGLGYPLLFAGPTEAAAAAAPFLEGGVRTFPTLLFVDRDGRLRRVHAGFYSAANGTAQQSLLLDLEGELHALLAEAVGQAAPVRTGTAAEMSEVRSVSP